MAACVLCAVLSMTSVPSFAGETDVEIRAGNPSVIYVSESGSDSRGDGSESSPYASLQKAYDESRDNGRIIVSGTVVIDDYMDILKFSEDKEIEISGESQGSILYDGDQNIDPQSAVMKITAGRITLKNITVKMPDIRGKNGRVLYIASDGEVEIGAGTVIENGYLAASSGNIYVGEGGSTVLDGGVVRNGYLAISNADAYGAGVFVDHGGTFLMKSGEISGNKAQATISGYRTFGGGAAVMSGGAFEMRGGKICGNTAETGGAGLYIEAGANVLLNAASAPAGGNSSETGSGGAGAGSEDHEGFLICDNLLRRSGAQSNMYFAEQAEAGLSGSMEGAKVGVTCEDDYYGRVVFRSAGNNTISPSDESAFFYDDGAYDIRMDSFTEDEGNLILWHWTAGVQIKGSSIQSLNPAAETPKDCDYETTIVPEDGYELPEQITIEVGGTELDPGDYLWNPETGEIEIGKEHINGDIVIWINADEVYEVEVACSNVSADITSAELTNKELVNITFTPVRKYGLPENSGISVKGACDWSYDEKTGVLTIKQAEENISVTAAGSEIRHTVFFDPAGGTLKPGEETKEFNESDPTAGELPKPEKEGYHFDGWFDSDGNKVTEDTPNDHEDDITLKAHWSANTNISYVIHHYVEQTDSGINPVTDSTDESLISLKDTSGIERTYYLYASVKYYDGIADSVLTLNDRIMDCDRVNMNTLSIDGFSLADFNRYEYEIAADGSTVINWYYNRNDVTVNYDGNGGTASYAKTSVKYGSCFGTLAAAQRDGYTFDGWFTDPRGGKKVDADEICTSPEELTLYAHWKANGTTEYKVYHRIQNLDKNRVDESHTASNTTLFQTEVLYGTSDQITDLYAMAIDGFLACPDNRYQVYINADGSASAVLYYDRMSVTVKYDPNGGTTASGAELQTKIWYGGVMGAVQTPPQREGYKFTGWYTAADGGKKVDEKTGYDIVSDGREMRTVYAHWEKKDDSQDEPQKPNNGGSGGGGSSGSGGGSGSGSGTKPNVDPPKEEDNLLTKDHIKYLNGYPDLTFRADRNMTRAEAAQMFFNLLEKKESAVAVGYRDVKASAWYSEAVNVLSEMGIFRGYEDGTFRPDHPITRAEFVMAASGFFHMKTAEDAAFADVVRGSWYYDVIASAAAEGWITGYPDGTFRPDANITRAEVASIVNKALDRAADRSFIDSHPEKIVSFQDLRSDFWAYDTIMEAVNAHDFKMNGTDEVWSEIHNER